MTIVTTTYRPKRAPRKKRKQPAIVSRIVTPPKLRPLKGPVIRLRDREPEKANANGQEQPKRSVIVEPKRTRDHAAAMLDDITPEEIKRRGDAADALFRKITRKARDDG